MFIEPRKTLPTRNNNPLNLKYGEATRHWVDEGHAELGDKATDGGQFLKFKTPEEGFTAARELLSSPHYSGLSVNDALHKWSNQGYGEEASGLPSGLQMADLSAEQNQTLIASMAKREGFGGDIPASTLTPRANEYDQLVPGLKGDRNEYDDLLGPSDTALRGSMLEASTTTPDHHAQVLKLSNQTLLPPEIVERNFDQIQQRAVVQANDYDRILKDTPKLGEWLSDPDNAKVARDDIPQLGTLTKLLDLGRMFGGEAIRGTGQALSGLGALNDTAARSLSRVLRLPAPMPGAPALPWWLNPSEILRAPGRELQTVTAPYYEPPPERQQGTGPKIAGSLGGLLPAMGTAIVAGPEAAALFFAGQGAEGIEEHAQQLGKEGTPEADTAVVLG